MNLIFENAEFVEIPPNIKHPRKHFDENMVMVKN